MNSSLPLVLIGPVIGKVTENSARILIELNRDFPLTISLYVYKFDGNYDNERAFISLTRNCTANNPIIFEYNNLYENKKYFAIIMQKVNYKNPQLSALITTFKTLNSLNNSNNLFRIGFMSCNSSKFRVTIPDKVNLWKSLSEKIEQDQVDYCIHIGDQVYIDDGEWKGNSDNCFGKCKKLWSEAVNRILKKSNNVNEFYESPEKKLETLNEQDFILWETEKSLLLKKFIEIIQEEYRDTWNYYYQAKAFRSVPNLMILDDHEIFDDFGFKLDKTSNKKSFEFNFAQMARICYYKYQKQLWENVNFDDLDSTYREHHFHILNGVGLFIQDFRGCFTWFKRYDNQNRILGSVQHKDIEDCFGPNGLFNKAKCALYISANPLVFLSSGISRVASIKVDDCIEQWSLQSKNEQVDILDTLSAYRQRNEKDIALISGDVHVGCFTHIYKNKIFSLMQMITSPICQMPPGNAETGVVKFLLDIGTNLDENYSCDHVNETNDMNYGILEFRPVDKNYKIFGKHVRSNGKEIYEDEYRYMGYRDEILSCSPCGNCNIL